MDRSHALVAFLLGVCAALGVALVLQSGNALPQAHAQASGSGEMFAVTGTGTSGQSRDVLFLIDSRATRVAVYEYKDGNLSLGAVRNIEYDPEPSVLLWENAINYDLSEDGECVYCDLNPKFGGA